MDQRLTHQMLGSELQMALRSEEPLPASLLFDYPTIPDLADYLLERLEKENHRSRKKEENEDGPRFAARSRSSH